MLRTRLIFGILCISIIASVSSCNAPVEVWDSHNANPIRQYFIDNASSYEISIHEYRRGLQEQYVLKPSESVMIDLDLLDSSFVYVGNSLARKCYQTEDTDPDNYLIPRNFTLDIENCVPGLQRYQFKIEDSYLGI